MAARRQRAAWQRAVQGTAGRPSEKGSAGHELAMAAEQLAAPKRVRRATRWRPFAAMSCEAAERHNKLGKPL